MNPNSDPFVIPISYGSTEIIQTGQWGFQKPENLSMTAPCSEACPAGNPIVSFLDLAGKGQTEKALSALLTENPFPGVCGRVCFHPCESGCNRNRYDESVSIQALERYVFDAASDQTPPMRPLESPDARRAAVIGSGPAGLSFAYFCALLGHKVTVFEAQTQPGGVMHWGIPEYRLPKTVLKQEIQRILNLGVEIKTGVQIGTHISFDELGRFDAVFLAPGAGSSTPLHIPGEELPGVWRGVDFLRRLNSGHSITPVRDVIVIGGGNTAMDVARSVLRLGSETTVAYRRTRAQMPAIADEIAEAEQEGVRFEFLLQPVSIAQLDQALAVTFQRMKLSTVDDSGRPRAVPVDGEFLTLYADQVITAAGEQLDPTSLPQTLIKNNLIALERSHATTFPAMFAGGDAVDQPRTIVHAIASGKRAAISADLCFRGAGTDQVFSNIRTGKEGSLSLEAYISQITGRNHKLPDAVISYEQLNTLHFNRSPKFSPRKLDRTRRLTSFEEVNSRLSLEQASAAAARCFSCGTCNYCGNCYVFCPEGIVSVDLLHQTRTFNFAYCKGCGTCVKACPRHAIVMKDVL